MKHGLAWTSLQFNCRASVCHSPSLLKESPGSLLYGNHCLSIWVGWEPEWEHLPVINWLLYTSVSPRIIFQSSTRMTGGVRARARQDASTHTNTIAVSLSRSPACIWSIYTTLFNGSQIDFKHVLFLWDILQTAHNTATGQFPSWL